MLLVSVTNIPNIVNIEPVSQQVSVQATSSATVATTTAVVATTTSAVSKNAPVPITIKNATNSDDIERITKAYYKDTPILAKIAKCESRYRQYSEDGDLLRGIVNHADVGVMQINEKYHLAHSDSLGMNIHTLKGNLEYGALLYKEQGTRPWDSSRPCWGSPE